MIEAPTSWWTHAEALFDAPLELHYEGLDPEAEYKLRVVYAGEPSRVRIRLSAGDDVEIHPLMERAMPFRPLEFDIPRIVTQSGELHLRWTKEPGLGGAGRGLQVAEAWLIRK
jgi:hypothetical protein